MGEPAPLAKKRPRGLFCPVCLSTRLTFRRIYRPCPGVTIRYRRCAACNVHLKTKEVLVSYTYPRPHQ